MRMVCAGILLALVGFACSSGPTEGGGAAGSGGAGAITICSEFSEPSPCADGQECIDGYCLTAGADACHVVDDGTDGCDARSVCRAGTNGNRCYPVPACPSNGICPSSGEDGSTCNDGALPGKDAVCIPGRCLSDADCNDGAHCVKKKVHDLVGSCAMSSTSYESNGAGAAWETLDGCAFTPVALTGTKPQGATCSSPQECLPTCCACGGTGAILAALCDLDLQNPLTGKCGSAADACAQAFYQGSDHVCSAP